MPTRTMKKNSKTIIAVEQDLINKALAVRKRAYAPYSRYKVGAALLGNNGHIYVGCNVENASFGVTVCAERNAVAQAVAAGCRKFKGLVVATSSAPPASPCGLCRQVLAEFASDLPILLVNPKGDLIRTTLSALLPRAFTR